MQAHLQNQPQFFRMLNAWIATLHYPQGVSRSFPAIKNSLPFFMITDKQIDFRPDPCLLRRSNDLYKLQKNIINKLIFLNFIAGKKEEVRG